jgi:hypothetical protein
MLNMPANATGIIRYRQSRLVAFMVFSLDFRQLNRCRQLPYIAIMLAGLVPARQGARMHAWAAAPAHNATAA